MPILPDLERAWHEMNRPRQCQCELCSGPSSTPADPNKSGMTVKAVDANDPGDPPAPVLSLIAIATCIVGNLALFSVYGLIAFILIGVFSLLWVLR